MNLVGFSTVITVTVVQQYLFPEEKKKWQIVLGYPGIARASRDHISHSGYAIIAFPIAYDKSARGTRPLYMRMTAANLISDLITD